MDKARLQRICKVSPSSPWECRPDSTGTGTSGVLCRRRCDGRIWDHGMARRRCVGDGSHACQRTAQQGSSITWRGAGTGLAAIYTSRFSADVPLVAGLGLLVPVAPITMNGKGVVSMVAAGAHTCAPPAPPPSGLARLWRVADNATNSARDAPAHSTSYLLGRVSTSLVNTRVAVIACSFVRAGSGLHCASVQPCADSAVRRRAAQSGCGAAR